MMHKQKEMKAPRYESVFHKAMVNVFFTQNWFNDKIKRSLVPFDITPQQFNVLRILRHQHPKPATINLLKIKMLDKMSDASRIVDRLVQKELVNKQLNHYDKRAVDIMISERGLNLLKKMEKELDILSVLSSCLSEDEAEQLNHLLEKVNLVKG